MSEFDRTLVPILVRRSRAKIPMVRPNDQSMLPILPTRIDRLDIYRVQIRPGDHDAVAMSGHGSVP